MLTLLSQGQPCLWPLHDMHTHGFISCLVHVQHSHASQWAAGLPALWSWSRKHRRVVQDAVTLREEETAPALNLN